MLASMFCLKDISIFFVDEGQILINIFAELTWGKFKHQKIILLTRSCFSYYIALKAN